MAKDIKQETKRKLGRILAGTVLICYGVYVHSAYGLEILRNSFFFVVLIALIVDFLRVEFETPFFHDQFPMRPTEKKGLHGTTLASIGALLALSFFDFDIAITAVAIAIYGDSMAAIFGTIASETGFHIHKEKTFVGSTALFITAVIAGFIFIKDLPLILAMAVIATMLEMYVDNLPDDIIMPPFTAFAGQLAGMCLGIRLFPAGFSLALVAWGFLLLAFVLLYYLMLIYARIRKQIK